MATFLVKSDPETYGLDELEKDGTTRWDGVKNPVAQKHLRAMAKGDDVFIYHSGEDKAVVGLARADSAPYPDPKDKTGKLHVVDLRFVKRVKTPMTLATFKADAAFESMPLVRMPRLSVMPVEDAHAARVFKHCGL
jgi:predicted RNA-binding protein with PUA-like domain